MVGKETTDPFHVCAVSGMAFCVVPVPLARRDGRTQLNWVIGIRKKADNKRERGWMG